MWDKQENMTLVGDQQPEKEGEGGETQQEMYLSAKVMPSTLSDGIGRRRFPCLLSSHPLVLPLFRLHFLLW